ncbi:MAG: hypothetical protein QM776_05580 [Rhodocyclaceae bacterium]
MLKNFSLVLVALATLSGCASTYKEPASGPVVKLSVPRFDTTWSGAGFSGGVVKIAVKGQEDCADLEMLRINKGEATVVNVAANKILLVSVSRFVGNKSCDLTGSFVTKEGSAYALEFELVGERCLLKAYEEKSPSQKELIDIRRNVELKSDGLKACLKKD